MVVSVDVPVPGKPVQELSGHSIQTMSRGAGMFAAEHYRWCPKCDQDDISGYGNRWMSEQCPEDSANYRLHKLEQEVAELKSKVG